MSKKFNFIKVIALALVCILALSACAPAASDDSTKGDSNVTNPKEHETFKIGICEVVLNDESSVRAKWFKEYIGPKYNCEFVFSEACMSLEACMSFIENAADAGCKAIINYFPVPANTQALVELCSEYEMFYTENVGRAPGNEAVYAGDYEYFAGGFQADQPAIGKLFHDFLAKNLDTKEKHGFIVATGGAYNGNQQQTEISANMLKALEEVYDMKFDKSIKELYTSSSPIQATNNKGIDVYCYPGIPAAPGWLEGMGAALQTGKYDNLLCSCGALGNLLQTIGEVEKALNKNINLVSFGVFGEALSTALNSKDQFGNQVCSMSTVKFTTLCCSLAFAQVYNCLTGNRDVLLDKNGDPSVLVFRMEAVTSPEELKVMSGWDTDGKWVADEAFINTLLAERTEGLSAEKIQSNISAMDYNAIKDRLG